VENQVEREFEASFCVQKRPQALLDTKTRFKLEIFFTYDHQSDTLRRSGENVIPRAGFLSHAHAVVLTLRLKNSFRGTKTLINYPGILNTVYLTATTCDGGLDAPVDCWLHLPIQTGSSAETFKFRSFICCFHNTTIVAEMLVRFS